MMECNGINLEGALRGCALAVRGEEIVFSGAWGMADLANGVPNTPGTKFATASAGKVFVAVAVLQLIAAGRLRLGDALGDLLPMDWRAIDTGITVEELLTHTSGIPDYFDEDTMEDYGDLWREFPNYKIRANADLLPLFIDKPMQYPRGAKFQYNNTGYVVLAMILEAMTGLAFDRLLEERIFSPCGMADTGYYELDCLPAGCASHYIWDKAKERWRTNIYSVDAKGTGAGGAFTTVGDIRRFWDGLLSHRLLSPALTAQMLAPHALAARERRYGYGVWLRPSGGGWAPYFQGSDPGVSFLSAYDPADGQVTTLVSNYGDDVWRIWRDLREKR